MRAERKHYVEQHSSLPSRRTPLRPLRGILKKTPDFESTLDSLITPFQKERVELGATSERPWNLKSNPSHKELEYSGSEDFLMSKSNSNFNHSRNSKNSLSSFAREGEAESRQLKKNRIMLA